jgi:hypothetical protein
MGHRMRLIATAIAASIAKVVPRTARAAGHCPERRNARGPHVEGWDKSTKPLTRIAGGSKHRHLRQLPRSCRLPPSLPDPAHGADERAADGRRAPRVRQRLTP